MDRSISDLLRSPSRLGEEVFVDAGYLQSSKEVLVEIVRLAQKQGRKGAKGSWKEFLEVHDKKFGAGLSDPAKRSTDILVAFLKTFTQVEDLKFFGKIVRRRNELKTMEQFMKGFLDQESPQQRLVRLTMEHPNYARSYSFPSHEEGWTIVHLGEISKSMESKSMLTLDCEMVLCEDGTDAVVKICVVNHKMQVKLDKLVKPNKVITDYRTHITGISAEDLEGVTCSLVDIQKSLKSMLSRGTILVGHSLHNDLRALKVDHLRVIDTSYIFTFIGLPANYIPSLNNLCKSVLGFEVRKDGEPHNCCNDATATMKLVLAKLDNEFDHPIAIEANTVPKFDRSKLLLHNVPVDIPCEELLKIFSTDYNVDIQTDVRIRGESYSTFAVFKDATNADNAYREIKSHESKDKHGRPHKLVSLKCNNGRLVTFYVRGMTPFGLMPVDALPNKRGAGEIEDSKRQRLCSHQCDHAQEVEKLKLELRQRDEEKINLQKVLSSREDEIFNLQKILSAISRNHGL